MTGIVQRGLEMAGTALTSAKNFVKNNKTTTVIAGLTTAASAAALSYTGVFDTTCTETCVLTGWNSQTCVTRCIPGLLLKMDLATSAVQNFVLENKGKVAATAMAIGYAMDGKRYVAAGVLKAKAAFRRFKRTPLRMTPTLGIIGGVGAGIASRILSNGPSFFEKSRQICEQGFSPLFWKTILQWKNWEIKNCALLTPLLPFAMKIIYDAARSNNPNGIYAKLKEASMNNLSMKQAASLMTILGGLSLVLFENMIGPSASAFMTGPDLLNIHLILKIFLADFLGENLGNLASRGGKLTKAMAAMYGTLYAFTDAVLICNNVKACHTIHATTAAIGLAIAVKTFMKNSIRQARLLQQQQFLQQQQPAQLQHQHPVIRQSRLATA